MKTGASLRDHYDRKNFEGPLWQNFWCNNNAESLCWVRWWSLKRSIHFKSLETGNVTLFGTKGLCRCWDKDFEKRRLSWIIWLYLYPVMDMLIRHTEERQTEKEEKEWRWKQRLKWPQAKNAKDCWQLPKAGREAWGRFPPRIYDTLTSECLASQTVKKKSPSFKTSSFGNLLHVGRGHTEDVTIDLQEGPGNWIYLNLTPVLGR